MLGLSMSQIWAQLMRGFWSGGHKNSVWAGSGQEWQMKPGYSDRLFFLVYNIFNIFESIIYCYKSVCFLKKKFLASLSKKKKRKERKQRNWHIRLTLLAVKNWLKLSCRGSFFVGSTLSISPAYVSCLAS